MIAGNGYFDNKNILVTGGAGSIGQELVKELAKTNARTIRVLDNNETGLFNLAHDLEVNVVGDTRMRFLIGDITNSERLMSAMDNIHIVFHAAALKHVPICEYNPFEAARVNVIGTQNCIDAAIKCNVRKMIFISTDKAVSPFSVMGATKLVAERLVLATNIFSKSTAFSCVRFGNVLNSRGSVVPVFKSQIASGGPITITNPSMTRFFMTISQAIGLILRCAKETKGDEIYVSKMPAINICDLASAMIGYSHEVYKTSRDIKTEIIGIRPGEKLFEELISCDEFGKVEDKGGYFIITRNSIDSNEKIGFSYASNTAPLISQDDIKKILIENKI